MSSPIDYESVDDRLKYAPPWARRQFVNNDTGMTSAAWSTEARPGTEPRATEPFARDRDLELPPEPPQEIAALPQMAPLVGDPTSRSREEPPMQMFKGDRAIAELRTRMALDPYAIPEPPQLESSRFGWKLVMRIFIVTAFAAGVAFAVVMFAFPEARRLTPTPQEVAPPAAVDTKKVDRLAALGGHRAEPASLVLIEMRRAAVNESVPLGVTITGGSDDSVVLISGLAAGTRLSAGTEIGSGTWSVRLTNVGQVQVIPPPDFVGVMTITAALLAADAKVIDKSLMRIEWTGAAAAVGTSAAERSARHDDAAPSPVPPQQSELLTLDREEIDGLLKRGRDFIPNGDLAAARLVLRRAANGGDAQAALLLGKTFDPTTFEQMNVIGAAPDLAEAQRWYQRATELGSSEAERRLVPSARSINPGQ